MPDVKDQAQQQEAQHVMMVSLNDGAGLPPRTFICMKDREKERMVRETVRNKRRFYSMRDLLKMTTLIQWWAEFTLTSSISLSLQNYLLPTRNHDYPCADSSQLNWKNNHYRYPYWGLLHTIASTFAILISFLIILVFVPTVVLGVGLWQRISIMRSRYWRGLWSTFFKWCRLPLLCHLCIQAFLSELFHGQRRLWSITMRQDRN